MNSNNKVLTNSLLTKKKLGAFYTPDPICKMLSNWAITSPNDKVLEPSFGQCGFLTATRDRLLELGATDPERHIFGCDIDPTAFDALNLIFENPVSSSNFIQEDFMHLFAGVHWKANFNASVGNPPYISSHKLSAEQRNNYAQRWLKIGLRLEKRASLWAHFLVHTISFLSSGARLAWVLPGALLQADYAKALREYIGINFEESICILMKQRYFLGEGTEEETVILLAKNKRLLEHTKPIAFADAANLDELNRIILEWDNNLWTGLSVTDRPAYLYTDQITTQAFDSLNKRPETVKIGDYINILIGIVTGANPFFVITEPDRQRLELSTTDVTPIFSRFKAATGIEFTLQDHEKYLESNGRGHLVQSLEMPNEKTPLYNYLQSFPKDQIKSIKTFKSRQVWHAPDDGKIPDVFLSVMNHDGPRIVLNDARINCTNTIHRGFFKKYLTISEKKLICISMLTSFSQLSAEFVGRRYGSGVLKHEPSEMRKISLILPSDISDKKISTCFDKINAALRAGNTSEATKIADKLLIHRLDQGKMISEALIAGLENTRHRRQKSRHDVGV